MVGENQNKKDNNLVELETGPTGLVRVFSQFSVDGEKRMVLLGLGVKTRLSLALLEVNGLETTLGVDKLGHKLGVDTVLLVVVVLRFFSFASIKVCISFFGFE